MFAANVGDTKLIDLLLRHGADVNGSGGGIPLMMAIECGWTGAAKVLISRGANVNLRRYGLWTALEWALLQNREEIVPIIGKAGGKGRPMGALRKAMEAATRRWELEHPAPVPAPSRDRVLTDDDQSVLDAVLVDLLTEKSSDAFLPGLVARPDLVLINKTPSGRGLTLSDDQLNAELDTKQANDVTLAMREHLAQQNGEAFSLTNYKPTSTHIVLAGEEALRARFGFSDKHPRARGWIQVYLPGYSMDQDRAILRFYLGPSAHGAAGTYFLIKQADAWRVEWRHFAFYL